MNVVQEDMKSFLCLLKLRNVKRLVLQTTCLKCPTVLFGISTCGERRANILILVKASGMRVAERDSGRPEMYCVLVIYSNAGRGSDQGAVAVPSAKKDPSHFLAGSIE